MLKWILAALAFFGLSHGATAPAQPKTPAPDPTQAPTTAPAQQPVSPMCSDGSPYPPPPGCK